MNNIPEHVAIIMDGNGRYAKAAKMPRSFGHIEGAKRVEPICRLSDRLGIKYLTLYAFSTENYKRPKEEVDRIMSLLGAYIQKFLHPMMENNMSFQVIGDRRRLSKGLLKRIERVENGTRDNTGLKLILAINYGGHDELVRAVNSLIAAGHSEVDGAMIAAALDSANIPDPDLIIRTGGDKRLSNFLIWQSAYSELYFCDKYWPEFQDEDYMLAIEEYQNRKRRFGGL